MYKCRWKSVTKKSLKVLLTSLTAAVALTSTAAAGLSPSEQQMSSELADNQPWPTLRSLVTNQHQLGVQTLSVELDERKKGDPRLRARVYQFNYNSQQSRLVLINVEDRSIAKVQPIDTVHLPLNAVEIELARDLIENDAQIMQRLNDLRQNRGLSELNDLSSIEVKASIFEPDNALHVCSVQRCALISLFDQTRTVFAVEPLVNLQETSVTTLREGF